MRGMSNSTRILGFILFLPFIFSSVIGCGSFSKKLKRQLGMRKHSVKVKDLGSDYAKFSKTEFDFFNHSKKVRKLTKRKPLRVSYHSFKVKGFDGYIKTSNVIYAQYLFANASIDKFHASLKDIFGAKFLKLRSKDISAALKKKSSKKSKINRLKRAYRVMLLAIKATKDIVTQSKKLVKESQSVFAKGKKSLLKKPNRALLLKDMLFELKDSAKRLGQVLKGTPKLAKKIADTRKFIPIIGKLI